nr:U-box domain-containing protein 21-like [Ziziphus jujuba var. spinosa]
MVFGWRRRKTSPHGNKKKKLRELAKMEFAIPDHFLCPISLDLMKDPVTLSSGITYDRESIEKWLEAGNFTCPVTNQVLGSFDQIPNHSLRKMIQEWCSQNQTHGVQRIPTPKIPVMAMEVSEILFSVSASTGRLDSKGCLESVQKIQKWAGESERNRKCIVMNGTANVLASAFDRFAQESFEKNASLCEEILSALNWMFPFDKETQWYLGSETSLNCMVWFLRNSTDLSAKQNSILTMEEVLSSGDHKYAEELAKIDGAKEILVEFIRKQVSPTITKASLMSIFYMASSSSSSLSEKIKSEFVEMGLVSLLVENLVDSEMGMAEKALGVMDELCGCEKGRRKAYENALTIPVLVKKLLRVSEVATGFSVSAIWKLCKFASREEERALVEALQVGCFQKLLLILQVGCGDETKEKATELLKLLNPYRAGLECIETVDFKNLKRSF